MSRHSAALLTLAAGAVLVLVGPAASAHAQGAPVVDGARRVWQPVTVSFRGPRAAETDDGPNPFLDYRLQVRFEGPGGRVYDVPGFFDGDGNGGGTGDVWRARFTPDAAGTWRFRASFRAGSEVAVALGAQAGAGGGAPDGQSGSFSVGARDPNAPGHLRWGRLEYVGAHYLKFRDGPFFVKVGADSPEDLLAYDGFEDTPFAPHRFAGHVRDWRPGDPDWGGGRGRGIIGALNYLAEQQVNSIYFLPMNIGGDGKNVWPFVGPIARGGSSSNDDLHYDVGKLRQWETVLAHAERRGIHLHFVLNEAEAPNKRELDDGQLGVERKLYYRELVARFGHHNALQWNLCEEYDLGLRLPPDRIKAFAGYLQAVDSYDHPITVHQVNRNLVQSWGPFVGDSRFSLTSFQSNDVDAVADFRRRTAAAGRPLPIGMDEFTPRLTPGNQADHRRRFLWPILLSGGTLEYITADMQATDDFRPYEALWRWGAIARGFLESLPFHEMEPAKSLVGNESSDFGGGRCFKKDGEVYAVYLPNASRAATLDLRGAAGAFEQRWFDPRAGRFVGAAVPVAGGAVVNLGAPPSSASQDWVVLVQASGSTPPAPTPPPAPPPPPPAPPVPAPAPAPAPAPPAVTIAANGFELIDADADRAIGPLRDGDVVDLATLPTRKLSVRAITTGRVGSVSFRLDGRDVQTENVPPYALAGDRGGDYAPAKLPPGAHRIEATPFSGTNGAGRAGRALRISVTVIDGGGTSPAPRPTGPAVTGFTLIDADTDRPIRRLRDGDVVDLRRLPTRRLSVRAETSGAIGSVRFRLDGRTVRIENAAPYALSGDRSGDYRPWTPSAGAHELVATPHAGRMATGAAGTTATVRFRVTR